MLLSNELKCIGTRRKGSSGKYPAERVRLFSAPIMSAFSRHSSVCSSKGSRVVLQPFDALVMKKWSV